MIRIAAYIYIAPHYSEGGKRREAPDGQAYVFGCDENGEVDGRFVSLDGVDAEVAYIRKYQPGFADAEISWDV